MDLKIPGLSGALEKLDDLPEKMEAMNDSLIKVQASMARIVELLEEQNEIHRSK